MSLPQIYTALIANGKGKEPTLKQLPLPTPGQNQLLVKIAFAPINPADLLNISQDYPLPIGPPNPVGLEGSGTVVAIGEDLKVPHQIGDRVHVRALGTHGQYVLADSESLRKIQDGLSFEEAASHFVNPATIVSMGDYAIKNGHKAVIHTAGSSALGRLLIKYLKHKGIKTINIVRRDDFTEELKKEGADYVLNSQAPDFETQLKEIAHREGATLAFDAIGGDMTAKLLRNQPKKSEVSLYGLLAGGDISTLKVHDFLFEGKRVTGFYVLQYIEEAEQTGQDKRLLDETYALLPTVLNSKIQKVFKLEDIKEALAFYQINSSKGKILIKPN